MKILEIFYRLTYISQTFKLNIVIFIIVNYVYFVIYNIDIIT